MPHTVVNSEKDFSPRNDCKILCLYVNITSSIQVIRLIKCPSSHGERIVFPGQRLMFEAIPEANLEIQSQENVTSIISCDQLRVVEI